MSVHIGYFYKNANKCRGNLHSRTRASRTYTRPGDQTVTTDDYHVTVRMGKSPSICHLHGHLYMHQTRWTKIAVEMMKDEERMVELGKGRELKIWGLYPEPSVNWPRLGSALPEFPRSWKPKDADKYPIIKYPEEEHRP